MVELRKYSLHGEHHMNTFTQPVSQKSNIRTFVLLVIGLLAAFSAQWLGVFMFPVYALSTALIAFAPLNAGGKGLRLTCMIAGLIIPCCMIPASFFIGNGILSFTLFIPVASLLIIFVSDKKRMNRTATIISISVFVAVFIALSVILVIYGLYSSLSKDVFLDIQSKLTDSEWLIDYLSEVNPDVATNEVWLSVTDEILSDIFNLFVWFAPAILAFVALAYAWMTTAVYRFFAVVRQDGTTRDYSAWNITMSGVSAVVFLAAILCSFLSSYSDVDVFYVVSSNIAYILMPGFVYFGLKHSSVFWSFLCIFIMFWSFTGAITLLSLSGAFAAITISFRNRQKT